MKSKWWLLALSLCLILVFLSPLASSSPDGLEKVAEDKGFLKSSNGFPFQIIADYIFPGIENEAAETILAGFIGTILLFGIAYGVAWLLMAGRKRKQPDSRTG